MKKNILLALLITIFINIQSFATVNFIMNNYSAQVGTQITVPVKVTGFTNIVSIQGTIQFDQNKLTYVSVQQLGALGMVLTDFGVSQVSSGKLTFSWINGAGTGVNLSDSNVIFSITFNVSPTNTGICPLTFTTSPTIFEVVDGSYNTVGYNLVNGSVSIYTTVSVSEIQKAGFHLYQNEPNPFTENTRITFSLPIDGTVTTEVFDILGNSVSRIEQFYTAGTASVFVNDENVNGVKLNSGVYFYKVTYGKFSETKKMIFVR